MVQKTLHWEHQAIGQILSKVREKKAMGVHFAFIIIKLFPFLFGAKHVSLGRYTFTVIIRYRYACRYIS